MGISFVESSIKFQGSAINIYVYTNHNLRDWICPVFLKNKFGIPVYSDVQIPGN